MNDADSTPHKTVDVVCRYKFGGYKNDVDYQ